MRKRLPKAELFLHEQPEMKKIVRNFSFDFDLYVELRLKKGVVNRSLRLLRRSKWQGVGG